MGNKNIETDEFKKWFGKSVIVNDDGTPRKMYHGTRVPGFKNFNPKKSFANLGVVFFTPDPKFAQEYTDSDRGGIYPVYLSIKKLFDFGDKNDVDKLKEFIGDETIYGVRGRTPLVDYIPNKGDYYWSEHPLIFQRIKDMRYDGIKVIEKGVENIAVFRPNQIKSIFNKGSWSKKSKDISEKENIFEAFLDELDSILSKQLNREKDKIHVGNVEKRQDKNRDDIDNYNDGKATLAPEFINKLTGYIDSLFPNDTKLDSSLAFELKKYINVGDGKELKKVKGKVRDLVNKEKMKMIDKLITRLSKVLVEPK